MSPTTRRSFVAHGQRDGAACPSRAPRLLRVWSPLVGSPMLSALRCRRPAFNGLEVRAERGSLAVMSRVESGRHRRGWSRRSAVLVPMLFALPIGPRPARRGGGPVFAPSVCVPWARCAIPPGGFPLLSTATNSLARPRDRPAVGPPASLVRPGRVMSRRCLPNTCST